ncbi:MAG: hypothetical protein JOY96_10750 [Verrucomicrobia bacterium]|nr:hypothetical protein [Verrucomicrobiota bacterium]
MGPAQRITPSSGRPLGGGRFHRGQLLISAFTAGGPRLYRPAFVVLIVTQKATRSDEPDLDQILEAEAQSGQGIYADSGLVQPTQP